MHTDSAVTLCICGTCETVCFCLLEEIMELELKKKKDGKSVRKKKYARACKIKEHNLAQCHVCLK